MLSVAMLAGLCSVASNGQISRKSVTATEVNGTFRHQFGGKFRGNYNEIKILALGKGRLKMTLALTYPFIDGQGEQMANVGEDEGFAAIDADEAIFTSGNTPECKIKIKFVRPGQINVSHLTGLTDCGYGFNVSAEGLYTKVSRVKPRF